MREVFWRNIRFTVSSLTVFILGALFAAFLVAWARGNQLFDGSIGSGAPRSFWVWVNFKAYTPSFVGIGSILGVLAGQVQFWAWTRVHQQK